MGTVFNPFTGTFDFTGEVELGQFTSAQITLNSPTYNTWAEPIPLVQPVLLVTVTNVTFTLPPLTNDIFVLQVTNPASGTTPSITFAAPSGGTLVWEGGTIPTVPIGLGAEYELIFIKTAQTPTQWKGAGGYGV